MPQWLPGGKALVVLGRRCRHAAGVPLRAVRAARRRPSPPRPASRRAGAGASRRRSPSARASPSRPTLVRLDLGSGKATKLSTFNDAALADIAFGKVESVTYKGARGDDDPDVGRLSAGLRSGEEVPGLHAAARRPAQRDDRRRAVALERAGVRELGLHRHVAQLPRLERLRPGVRRFDQSRTGSSCRTRTRSRPRNG